MTIVYMLKLFIETYLIHKYIENICYLKIKYDEIHFVKENIPVTEYAKGLQKCYEYIYCIYWNDGKYETSSGTTII